MNLTYKNSESFLLSLENAKTTDEVNIYIDIVDFNKETIDFVMENCPNANFRFNEKTNQLTGKNLSELMDNVEYLRKTYNKDAVFYHNSILSNDNPDDIWSMEKVLTATEKLDGWASEINNATVDGQPLSNFEKYLYAYQIVTDFVYKDVDHHDSFDDFRKSRDIVSVLNSDNIVCVGYADLLSELCQRVGIDCVHQDVISKGESDNPYLSNHANCCVNINDKKYGIFGTYYSDPCWDSKNQGIDPSYNHSFLKYDELSKIYGSDVVVDLSATNKLVSNNLQRDKNYSPTNTELEKKIKFSEEELKKAKDNLKSGYNSKQERAKFQFEYMQSMLNLENLRDEYNSNIEKQKEDCKQYVSNRMLASLKALREKWNIQPSKNSDSTFLTSFEGTNALMQYLLIKYNAETTNNQEAKQICDSIILNYPQLEEILVNFTDEELQNQIPNIVSQNVDTYGIVSGYSDELIKWAKNRNQATNITKDNFTQALTNVNISRGMSNAEAYNSALNSYDASIIKATIYCDKRLKNCKNVKNIFVSGAYNDELGLNENQENTQIV